MNRWSRSLSVGLLPVSCLLIWWAITHFNWVPRLFLPSPAEVIQAVHDAAPKLAPNAAATLIRLICGFSLGVTAGYAVGLLMVLYRPVRESFGPAIDSGRAAPTVATLPFFLLWFGFAAYGQVLFIAIGVALIVASGVLDAGRTVPPHLIRAAQTFQASRWQLARTVLMPGLLPSLVPTLRICLGVAGSLTIMSEFMGADYGLGVILDLARRTLRTENLILFTFVLGVLVLVCDLVLRIVISYLLRWMPKSTDALDPISLTIPK